MIFFTILTHVLVDEKHHLTASTVFVTMAYFVYIRRSSNCLAAVTDFIISVSYFQALSTAKLGSKVIRALQFSCINIRFHFKEKVFKRN